MAWIIALTGPTLFGVGALYAQTTTGGSSLTEVLVALGVISGLSGAIAKLWAENRRLQGKIEEAAEKALTTTVPALGEAIAEMRETRRERERMAKVLDRIDKILAEDDKPRRRT